MKTNTMLWYCLGCRQKFNGPKDRAPENGCPHCGSRNVMDLNCGPVSAATEAKAIQIYEQGLAQPIAPARRRRRRTTL